MNNSVVAYKWSKKMLKNEKMIKSQIYLIAYQPN